MVSTFGRCFWFLRNLVSLSSDPGRCEECGFQLMQLFEDVELSPDARLKGRVVFCSHCHKPSLQQSAIQRFANAYCKSCRRCSATQELCIDREPQAVRVGRVRQTKQCERCDMATHRILLIPRIAMPDAVIRRERARKRSMGG